ncbi:MAG: TetR family transcriptional regulator [Salinibacterium sp.]|nr:MAG: TetR family transcriptional regulator [Salinibacterium sp.]
MSTGLRERKRVATRRAIQLAVFELVSQHGLAGVTVEEIGRVADVAPRTFFNYFKSKEEALLGDPPELPDSELVESFIVAGPETDLFDGLASLLIDAGQKSVDDLDILAVRHRLLKQYPQLFAMRMARMRVFEEQITELVSRRLVRDDAALLGHPEFVRDRARLVTLVAFAALRHAWTAWVNEESSLSLAEQLERSFADLKSLFA